LPKGSAVFLFGGLIMSFKNAFKSSKKGQAALEFFLLAAVVMAVMIISNGVVNGLATKGQDYVNNASVQINGN